MKYYVVIEKNHRMGDTILYKDKKGAETQYQKLKQDYPSLEFEIKERDVNGMEH